MNIKSILLFWCLLGCFFITGCAEAPPVEGDIEHALAAKNSGSEIDVLKAQGERIAGTSFVDGNDVDLLRNGADAYPAMLAAIRGAKKRIDMESYTFDGKESEQFGTALLKRRAAGVEINVIYDSWGSAEAPNTLFDRLRTGGIRVLEYNPIDPASVLDASADQRDHRKLLLIDGKVAFVGGINISEVYRLKLKIKNALHVDGDSDDPDPDKLPWRDTQVKIEGPVVGEFERLFMQTWQEQKGPPLSPPPATPQTSRGPMEVQVVDSTPDLHRFMIYRSLVVAISLAQKSVHLTTGFFVPTPDLIDALEDAARRGVDVSLVLPGLSTSDFALKAGRGYYQDLIDAGVKIYERQGAILHAKTTVIDGIYSMVGSFNLDWRSAVINNECDAVILGNLFGTQMENMFVDDIKLSHLIDPQEWSNRSFWERLDEWKARLIESLL